MANNTIARLSTYMLGHFTLKKTETDAGFSIYVSLGYTAQKQVRRLGLSLTRVVHVLQ